MARHTLDPKLDLVFKMLFGAPENRDLLRSFLEAVLIPPIPIGAIEVLRSDPPSEGFDDKGIALDLRVRLANGEQVDVEMQTQPRPAQRQRALYYWARLYGGQLSRGETYARLHRCVVVVVLGFRELEGVRFHSTFRVNEVHDHEPFSADLELHLLELPKLAGATNDEPELLGWGRFLAASTDEELDRLAMTDPALQKAKAALDRLSADPEARELAEQREMALHSYALDLEEARAQARALGTAEGRAEGRAEGLEEGRAEGRADLLLHLLNVKFGDVAAPIRHRVIHASGEDLTRWAERLVVARSLDEVFSG